MCICPRGSPLPSHAPLLLFSLPSLVADRLLLLLIMRIITLSENLNGDYYLQAAPSSHSQPPPHTLRQMRMESGCVFLGRDVFAVHSSRAIFTLQVPAVSWCGLWGDDGYCTPPVPVLSMSSSSSSLSCCTHFMQITGKGSGLLVRCRKILPRGLLCGSMPTVSTSFCGDPGRKGLEILLAFKRRRERVLARALWWIAVGAEEVWRWWCSQKCIIGSRIWLSKDDGRTVSCMAVVLQRIYGPDVNCHCQMGFNSVGVKFEKLS